MSWTDQELDDLAQKANGELKFAYSPSYFQEVEAMLPRKKSIAGIIFLGTGITAAAVILSLLFMDGQAKPVSVAKTMDYRVQSSEFRVQNAELRIKNEEVQSSEVVVQSSEFGVQKEELRIKNEELRSENVELRIKNEEVESSEFGVQREELRIKNEELRSENVAVVGDERPKTEDRRLDNVSGDVVEVNEVFEASREEESLVERSEFRVQKEERFPVGGVLATLALPDFDFVQEVDGRFSQFPSRKKGTYLYYQAGLSMGQAIVENQGEHTKAFDLGAGIMYRRGYWSVRAGAALEYQSLNLTLAERTKHYGFSSDEYSNNLLYREFYNLNIPLALQFHSGKHHVQTGVVLNYIVSSKMNYSYYRNGVMERNETMYGQDRGITPFGAQATFGYGFGWMSNWIVGANVKWQMTDQVDKRMVEGSTIRPLSGQVFVRKTIKKR